jgi:hypothetical protein
MLINRMLKMTASFVLARHWALTGTRPPHVSAAFTNVTRFIQRVVNLAPVRKHETTYSSSRAPRRLNVPTWERACLGRLGAGG